MKKMIMATVMVLSSSAFADTVSQRTAAEMASVLQSAQVQELLQQEDGVGNLKGIKYVLSGRAAFGPSQYELTFESYAGPSGMQTCTVIAQVNIQTKAVMSVSNGGCK